LSNADLIDADAESDFRNVGTFSAQRVYFY
jgi:hypothetical protein